jgi:hypothetical protein
MHILFIDESGTPPKPGVDRPSYFVLAGAIIHESRWHKIRDALLGLKARHGIRGEIKWRYFAATNTDDRNPMRKLDASARDIIRRDVYKIMVTHEVVSLAAVCSVKAAYNMPSVNSQDDIYHLAYKVLSERFQYFCGGLTDTRTGSTYGIMVADHRGAQDDKRLRKHHEMLVHSGAEFTSSYRNIVESLFVQPSNLSVGIQLADMIAGAVWQKYERKNDAWFKMMEPTLRRSRAGKVDGYGLIKAPKAGWI